MDLAKHLFDTATMMNRVAAGSVGPRPVGSLDTVYMLSLNDRVLGHYRKEERAVVEAHRIRVGDVYAGLTWQKVTHAHSGRQVWTCDVHGETVTLVVEPRRIE